MTWRSFAARTGTVLLAVPLFYCLLFLFPQASHLAFNIALIAVAVLGSREMEGLLRRRGSAPFGGVFPFSALIPAAAVLEVLGLGRASWSALAAAGLAILLLLRGLWVHTEAELEPLLGRLSASLLVLLYPAVFLSFVVRLSSLPRASWVLLLFFSITFANDILAYLAGMFLGRSTKLNYPVSPNKSAVGFIAGVLAAVATAFSFKALVAGLIPMGYTTTALFGAAFGVLTIAGDLVESALKRSAGVKDSGRVIPGRGGILDSIDSWLLSAPVMFFVFRAFSR